MPTPSWHSFSQAALLSQHCLTPAPGSNNQWESPLAETLSLKINYNCLTLALMNFGG